VLFRSSVKTDGGRVFLDDEGTFDYAPRRGFTGTDGFTYTVEGEDGVRARAGIEIEVGPIDPAVETGRFTGYVYETGLGRFPDIAGLNFWASRIVDGRRSEETVANDFLISDEFASKFGAPDTLTDRELVETLYLNQLGRAGETAGVDFWTGRLAADGFTREDLLIAFAESPENQVNAPRIADIRRRDDDSFDFGLELAASAGAVTEGDTLTYTLETGVGFPDGETFEIVFEGDDLDDTAAPADPLDDIGTRDGVFLFQPGAAPGDTASFDIAPIADARDEGDEGLAVSVRDRDGIEVERVTTLLRDGDGDGSGGGDGDDPDDGDGGGGGDGPGGGGGASASWSLTVSTDAPNPGFDPSGTTTGTEGQLSDVSGDALFNFDRITDGMEESIWVITDPDLPELSGSPQEFDAELIQFTTTGPGGFPLVLANLDPFSAAQPPAELTLDRVTADVVEGSVDATIFDAFGAEYDVTGTFTLPNEALDLA